MIVKTKQTSVGLLCLVFFLTLWCVPVHAADDVEIVIDSVEIFETGEGTIVGHCTDSVAGTQISCLIGKPEMFNEDGSLNTSKFDSCVMYIDQVSTGNNGTFLINFGLAQKWSECEAKIGLGCTYGVNAYATLNVPDMLSLGVVQNNSVLYGREIFLIGGIYYTPEYISNALSRSGNNIYFCIGDNWYNLMSDDAVDNSFLVPDNASPLSEVETIAPGYYYGLTTILELKWLYKRAQFMNSDVNVTISGYVPTITGTLGVEEGTTLTLRILNKTDNTTIAEESITEANGVLNLNYQLPNLLYKKEYEICVSCTNDKGEEKMQMRVDIDASILSLNVSGAVNTLDNVDIEGRVNTVNLGLIDENIAITGDHSISKIIPNLLANASFHLNATAYEKVNTFEEK